jgi:putative ABC transport system ATP-binding protein
MLSWFPSRASAVAPRGPASTVDAPPSSARVARVVSEPPVASLVGAVRTYTRGQAQVRGLDAIDLTIHRREWVSIIGASGSGKSTLLNVLGTLDALDQGVYELDGQNVTDLDDDALSALRNRKIGFVFQSFQLLPRYTALENVALPLAYAGVGRKERLARAEKALARVGLAARGDHRPLELSGGQQQRVAVARALVAGPSLLLADEPTGALDSTTAANLLELFHELHADGVTLVLVTHDAAVAAHADRVVTMRDGRVLADERQRPRGDVS